MRVITVARKPLSEGNVALNVLKWGTGGLNIDGCRIAHSEECHPMSEQQSPGGFYAQGGRHAPTLELKPSGRWPANLILQHKPGCKCIGEAEKATRADTRPEGDGGRRDRSNWRFRPTAATRRSYGGEDGIEIVPVWECESGCPVAALDAQSGNLSVCGGAKKTTHDSGMFGIGSPGVIYEDKGGASRFFKQVKP